VITPGDVHLRRRARGLGDTANPSACWLSYLRDTGNGEGMRWALGVLGLVTHQVPHCGTGAHQPFVIGSSGQAVAPPALRQQIFPLPARSRAAAGWQLVSFGCGRTAHFMEEDPSARAMTHIRESRIYVWAPPGCGGAWSIGHRTGRGSSWKDH
jgi:hypothetical protein